MSSWSSSAAVAVQDRLFRALAVLRAIVLVNAIALNVYRAANFEHPAAGAACVAVMVVWTGFATWAYADAARRGFPLLAADLLLALALLLLTPVVKGSGFHATVPGFWIMGALMAWAIQYRWVGGLVLVRCGRPDCAGWRAGVCG